MIAGRPVVLGEPELVRQTKNREYRLRAPCPGDTHSRRAATLVLDRPDGRKTTYTFTTGACTTTSRSR